MEAQTVLMIAVPVIALGAVVFLIARWILGPHEREPATGSGHEQHTSSTQAPSGCCNLIGNHEVKNKDETEEDV